MTKNFTIKLTFALAGLLAILLICICIFPSFGKQTTAYGETAGIDFAAMEQCTAEMNDYLATEYNTTAYEQLEKMSAEYTDAIHNATNSHLITKLTKLNGFTDRIKKAYATPCSDFTQDFDDVFYKKFPVLVERVLVMDFLMPMFAILDLLGWDLFIELTMQSFMFLEEPAEPYVPVYGYKVKSSQLFKDIANGSEKCSDPNNRPRFPFSLDSINGDLCVSIHDFDYTKPSSSSKTVTITDPFAYDRKNISEWPWYLQIPYRFMCDLLDANLITNFDWTITESLSESLSVITDTWGYQEKRFELEKNELKDYEVKFTTSGRRLIQTFGTGTTDLHILDEEGKTLAYDKGSGYEGNALISFNFEKDTKYVIRIADTDRLKNTDIRLSIFNHSNEVSSFDQLDIITVDEGEYNGSVTPNVMYMAKFKPQKTKQYNIKFNIEDNFCAFLICLDSADEEYSTTFYKLINPNPSIFVDPSLGENDPGKNTINKTLYSDANYLLLVCGKPANSRTVNFSISVS